MARYVHHTTFSWPGSIRLPGPPADLVSDEKVSIFDVFCTSGARELSIRLQKNTTLVVLEHNVALHFVPLCLDEVLSPERSWQYIVRPNELVLS